MGEWSTLLLLKMNSQRAEVTMKVRKQQGLRLEKQANHGTNSLLCPTKNFHYMSRHLDILKAHDQTYTLKIYG